VPAAVETIGLSKSFGAFRAVDDVSFDVTGGEIFGLLGSNGAGKSTVIRMLTGLLRPTGGKGMVLGVDVAKRPADVRRRIGYMTQRFSLYDDLTVVQNLRFYGGIYGLSGAALARRVDWALGVAGLAGKEGLLTRSLPGGWKQRLALGSAVLHEPQVLFLDEPTGGVDPVSRRRFWELIDDMAQGGVTVIVTTHYLDEAEHCGRIALMHAGRLVALGTVSELKGVFAGRAVLEVATPRVLDAAAVLEGQEWVLETSAFGNRLHVVVADAGRDRIRIAEVLAAEGYEPVEVQQIVPSLEDVFIHYIERSDRERSDLERPNPGPMGMGRAAS
jgi:ABC-2 type transport system ATP-binding protein